MHGALYPVLAALAWAATGYRLLSAHQRGPGTPARRAVTNALALLAVTFTVSTPAVWTAADRLTGVNNIAALVAHLCVVAFSTTIQVLLLWWAEPTTARRRARHRQFVLGTVALVLLGLFVAAGPTESRNTDFVATYAGRPHFAVYLLAYLTAFAAGLVDIIRICWPYARLVGTGWLRTGLRTTTAGAAVGLVYCTVRALDIVEAAAGWNVHRGEALVPLSSSVGALLVILGLTMPAWGPRLAGVAGTVDRVRLLRQLHPLWHALSTAVPAVRLTPDRAGRWRPAERLHRRVVEIYDARLALRPYLSEAVGERARRRGEASGLRGDELAAVVEAAKLRAALTAVTAESRPRRPEEPATPDEALDEVREMRQLARVARAFAHSPLVADAALETVNDH
ncbi:MAB_1171c family putative transporter [Micromonospora echinofusca]|uniref:DUF6545 domain-containing protein n=1 Tax=Micromonospora echinofusca TaxID=47858 RepID=A0ABS3VX98_MICEH|nr:MAB_1171c family putative transporter [Micromonospora echinofusca]MBO4209176.1 hypothetical protein [Micromonospora echinofusca]